MIRKRRSIRSKAAWLVTTALLANTFAAAGGLSAADRTASSDVPNVPILETSEKAPYVEGEVLVTYKPGIRSTDASRLRQSFALTPKRQLRSVGAEVLKLAEGADVEETVAKLNASGLVAHAQPNYLYYPSATEFDRLWGLQNFGQLNENDPGYGITGTYNIDIAAPRAWSAIDESALETVVVAVIDTGVDIQHPDLSANLWTNPGETAGNGVDDDGNGYIDDVHGWDFANDDNTVYDNAAEDAHGTHVAATIAGVRGNGGIVGATINAKIMPLKVLGEDGGTTESVIEAIRYADAMGAKISNNSWNGLADETDALLKAAIDAADTLFVGSAGNGNVYGEGIDTDLEPVSPNNIRSDKQITVAAIDPSGKLAPFSNYGSETVHLAAPGVAVYSAAPNGGYDYMDGTSMAAPHVAAAAAFVMGVRNLTVEETKELLLTASRPLPDLEGKIASGAMLSMLLPVSMVLPEAEVSLEDPAEFHNTAIEVKFRTTPFGALKAGEDTITIDLFGTAEPLDVSSPEVVSVNGVTLKAGDIMDDGSDGSAIVLRTPIGIAHDAPVVVRFSEAAGAINAVAGTYPHYVSTSVDRTSYDRTYTVVEDPTLPVVRFNNSGMPTKMPMNRTVTGVVYAELDNDAFTGTVGEAYGTNKFRVLQAPPGVSASAVKTSETTVSISVYGTDTTTIGSGQLLFMFDHGAFASGSYANVKNAIPQFYFWRYDQPAMNGIVIFTNNKFVESDWNDGSIQTWATAGLTFDTFAGTVGSLLTGDQVQFTGVPEGLTATARLLSKTIVQIELTGQAESHAVQDSTSGLTVTFTGAAYTSGLAAALPMNQLQVAFKDAPGKPAEVSAVQDGALVDLAWSAVADADRYVISAAEPEGRFFAVGETEENQYTDALLGFVPATIRYRIDAYRGNVVTHSEPVLVELEADHTYFEGVAALGGRPADGTKLTVRNADGSIRYQATFDAEDPKASVKEDHGIIQDGSELYIYFYAPNGTYTILLENGTWTSQRSVSPGTAWMLGEPITDVELRLYHVGDIGTMTLAAPQVADNPGGGGVFIPPAPPSGPPAEENANGEIVYKPSAVRETRDGVEVSVVTLTAEELAEALTGGTASGGRLVIEVDSEDAAEVRLPVGALAAADDVPVVEVRTGTASYRVPTSLLDPDALSAKFGVAPGAEWTVVVEMLPVTGPVEASLGATAADIGASLVGEPIDFAMRVETNGQTFDYNDFGSSYVERTIVADRGVNARTTTAARYDPESGSLSFVPATFRTEDGRTVVTVKRNGNSVYVLLESKRSFADLSGHWAKADVELLASKLVLNGTGPNAFSPDRHVTRAEFASMLTRALGLTPNAQAAGFTDVTDGAWYEGAVGAAVAYGLVTGFEDGTFRPNDRVTREQMAVMLERALTFAGGTASAAAGDAFADQADIGAWAVKAVAAMSAAGIVAGNPDGTFAPAAEANRAQAAVMLGRLLKRVGFID